MTRILSLILSGFLEAGMVIFWMAIGTVGALSFIIVSLFLLSPVFWVVFRVFHYLLDLVARWALYCEERFGPK